MGRSIAWGLLCVAWGMGPGATRAQEPKGGSVAPTGPDEGAVDLDTPGEGDAALVDGDEAAFLEAAAQFEASLSWQTGTIELGDGLAMVRLPKGARYLDPDQAARVLEWWGNPPDLETLGMIFPRSYGPSGEAAWGVLLLWTEDGYVEDDDAASIDYDQLLRDIQESTAAENEERVAQGYPAVRLLGWAEAPHYDAQQNKLFWAKRLAFEGSDTETLNYDVRVLGRRGHLTLQAVASMDELSEVRAEMPALIEAVNFHEGHRYADFVAGEDRVAEYGIAALVAGGVAAKAGLWKGLLLALKASGKFIGIGVLALAALVRRFLKSRAPNDGA